jgi:hypothetical protein
MHEIAKPHRYAGIALLAVLALAVAYLATPAWRESSMGSVPRSDKGTLAVHHSPARGPKESRIDAVATKGNAGNNGLVRESATLASSTPAELPTPREVLADLATWLRQANAGDPLAARAIHILLNACRPVGGGPRRMAPNERSDDGKSDPVIDDSCSGITHEIAQDRTRWLEIAARNGDVSSLVEYALHVRDLGLFETGWAWSDPQRTMVVQSQAIAFLSEAAAYGVAESYIELSRSFEFGHYGQKDTVRSLAYALALDQLHPGTIPAESLVDRMRKLSPSERASAQQMALTISSACCRPMPTLR